MTPRAGARCGTSVVLLMILTAGMLAVPARAAPFAGTFHQWSVARLSSPGGFDGGRSLRYDAIVSCPTGLGAPVYQPIWIFVPGGWLEMGTAHCSSRMPGGDTSADGVWWYWYSRIDDVVTWRANDTARAGQLHTMFLYRTTTCVWSVKVDATIIGALSHCGEGSRIEAGLETYRSDAVTEVDNSNLRFQTSIGGAWNAWAGTVTYTTNDSDQPLVVCVRKLSDTQIRHGENVDCL